MRGFLLDNNVWRYISDSDAGDELFRLARKSQSRIIIAPSVVYEALRTSNDELRNRLICLMADERCKRLMPEAFSETKELLAEIKRFRPGWLRAKTDRGLHMLFKHDWTNKKKGFWTRVQKDSAGEAKSLNLLGDTETLELARAQTANAREENRQANYNHAPSLQGLKVSYPKPVTGWRGDPVDWWRVSGHMVCTNMLQDPRSAYSNWLGGDLDIAAVLADKRGWREFWLYEVDESHLPRFWLRWAFEFLQRFQKTTPGSAADSQLASYLLETDVIVSSDSNFLANVDKCRSDSPVTLPAILKIKGGDAGVAQLLDVLSPA